MREVKPLVGQKRERQVKAIDRLALVGEAAGIDATTGEGIAQAGWQRVFGSQELIAAAITVVTRMASARVSQDQGRKPRLATTRLAGSRMTRTSNTLAGSMTASTTKRLLPGRPLRPGR